VPSFDNIVWIAERNQGHDLLGDGERSDYHARLPCNDTDPSD
jgi:hypothetical protein